MLTTIAGFGWVGTPAFQTLMVRLQCMARVETLIPVGAPGVMHAVW